MSNPQRNLLQRRRHRSHVIGVESISPSRMEAGEPLAAWFLYPGAERV